MSHPLILSALFSLLFFIPFAAAETEPTHDSTVSVTLSDRYHQVLTIDPDNLQLRYYLGIALLTEGRNEEAIEEFKKAYPSFIDSTEMNYNMGLALYQAGDLESALLYLERAEDLGALSQPDVYPLVSAYYNIGAAYLERESLDDAVSLFEKVLLLDPERHEIHRVLGDIHARKGESLQAIREYDAFLEAYPRDPETLEALFKLYYNEALSHLEKNDFAESRERFQKALETMPGSPLAVYYLGYLDYAEGRIEDASANLRSAFSEITDEEIRGSIASLLYNCAVTLLKQRKSRKALDAIAPLNSEQNPSFETLYLSGNIHLSLKEYNDALDDFDRIMKRNPAYPGIAANLIAAQGGAIDELFENGKALLNEGRYLDAINKFESAQAFNPADPRVKTFLAKARQEMQNAAEDLFAQTESDLEDGSLQSALDQVRLGLSYMPDSRNGIELEQRTMIALARSLEEKIAEGDRFLSQDALNDSEKAFMQALEIDPKNEHAKGGIDAIARKRIAKADLCFALGTRSLEEGDIKEAQRAFKEALLLRPGDTASQKELERVDVLVGSMVAEEMHWGRLAKNAGQYREAREHFSNALELSDTPETRKELDELDAAFSTKIAGLLGKAEEALTGGEVKSAFRHYQNILSLAPENADALQGLTKVRELSDLIVRQELETAETDMTGGNPQKALDRYRKVLDLDPANKEARNGLTRGKALLAQNLDNLVTQGKSALEKNSFTSAEKAFREVLKIDPYHAGAKAGLDRMAQIKNSGAKPGDEAQLYLQGIEYYTKGKYDKALALWEQVLILSPGHEKARMNIDKARRKMQQIKEFR